MEENENLIRGDSLIIEFPITDEQGEIIHIEAVADERDAQDVQVVALRS